MRRAIQEYLVANCPSFGGRFYYPYMTDPDTTKPYGVLKMSLTSPTDIQFGTHHNIEVWVYVDIGNWESVDTLLNEVEAELDDVVVDGGDAGKVHLHSLRRRMADFRDDDLRASVGRTDFTYVTL